MPRPLIALLAAVDACVITLATLAAVFAPLTIAWATSGREFSLWPTTSALWSFGFGTPLHVSIADETLVRLRIDPDVANFTVSLTPIVFALAVFWFAYGSGRRAAQAGSATAGLLSGVTVITALTAAIMLPTTGERLFVDRAWGMGIPIAVYVTGAFLGATVATWRARRSWALEIPPTQRTIIDAAMTGVVAASAAVIAVAAVVFAVRLVLTGSQAAAINQGLQVDAAGATALSFGQALYLPTAIVWTVSWLAGPGFAFGTDSMVNAVAATPSVHPPIPLFAMTPQHGSVWWLTVVIVPILAGVLAGWIVRSRLEYPRGWALTGTSTAVRLSPSQRAIVTGLIVGGIAAVWALLAVAASGGLGPGTLTFLGPQPLLFAGVLALEIGLGVAIMLLPPVRGDEFTRHRADTEPGEPAADAASDPEDEQLTVPLEPLTVDDTASSSAVEPRG